MAESSAEALIDGVHETSRWLTGRSPAAHHGRIVAADAIAIAIGKVLVSRLPDRWTHYGAAAAFAVFGGILRLDGIGIIGG